MLLIKAAIPGVSDDALRAAMEASLGTQQRDTLMKHDSALADELYDPSDKADL